MRFFKIIFLTVILFTCTSYSQSFRQSTLDKFHKQVHSGTVIAVFYNKHNPQSKPTIQRLKTVRDKHHGLLKIKFYETNKHKVLASMLGIAPMSNTVIIIFEKGNPVGVAMGEPNKEQLKELVEKCLKSKLGHRHDNKQRESTSTN